MITIRKIQSLKSNVKAITYCKHFYLNIFSKKAWKNLFTNTHSAKLNLVLQSIFQIVIYFKHIVSSKLIKLSKLNKLSKLIN